MINPEYKFVDTAFNGPNNRNNVMEIGQVLSSLPSHKRDCHTTWHRFPQEFMDHFDNNLVTKRDGKKTRSIANYTGPSYADFLPIDIDEKDDLPKALETARIFLTNIARDYDITSGIYCYFSGKKGFHICIANSVFGGWKPSKELPMVLKNLANRLYGDLNVDTGIYDQARLFRIPNTVNSQSGLHKIALSIDEIQHLTVDEILVLAKNPRTDMGRPEWEKHTPMPGAVSLLEAAHTEINTPKAKETFTFDGFFRNDLQDGDGRNNHIFKLLTEMKLKKVDREFARKFIFWYDSIQPDPLARTDGPQKIESMLEYHFPSGASGEGKNYNIFTFDELVDQYTDYVGHLKSRCITTGIPTIDNKIRGVAPGEVMTVIAKAGVGKTAFLMNVLRYATNHHSVNSLFCSMEQPAPQVFERFASMSTGKSGFSIEQNWVDEIYRKNLVKNIVDKLGKRVMVCDNGNLSLEDIETVFFQASQKIPESEEIGLLAIDYLGLIDGSGYDRTLYGQVSQVARQIKSLAKQLNVAILLLCQTKRENDDVGDKPLGLTSARDAGAIEESGDFVIGLHRPYILNPDGLEDDTMVVQLLKNRKGPPDHSGVECNFIGQTLTITERSVKMGNGYPDHRKAASGDVNF